MSAKHRVAIIGATGRGDYGHGLDVVWKDFSDQVEVVALAEDNAAARPGAQARTGASRAYADYREMLRREQPHIVAIAPRWPDQHAEMILAATEQGCHIYMEKPLCRTLAEADQIVAACERTHCRLAIAHVARYSPVLPVVQKLIADGQLGTLLEIRARGKEDPRGGAEDLWVLGSHMLNLMQTLAGEPRACTASLTVKHRGATSSDIVAGRENLGPLAGDAVQAHYQFEHGIQGYFASVRGQGGAPSRFGLQIFGSKGVLQIPSGYLEPAWFLPDSSWSPGRSKKAWIPVTSAGLGQPEPRSDKGNHAGNVAAVKDLLFAIEGRREPLCNVYAARWTIEMIHGVFASHVQGKPVAFPLANRQHPFAQWKSG